MLAIGSDHAGFALKEQIKAHLDQNGIGYQDFGAHTPESCNYAEMAVAPCKAVQNGECTQALLICGTGIGMSIAANKHSGIRAAVCSDYFSAKYTRLHNDANVLCMGERVVGAGLACELVDVFLSTAFEGGRHADRIAFFQTIEHNPSSGQ